MERKKHIYDYIVLGLGIDGSSTLYNLSKESNNILGIEQFSLNHKNGSSHGDTRIIRQSYFEGEIYIPLLKRVYELWDEIEHISGEKLFYKVGGLYAAKKNFNEINNQNINNDKEEQTSMVKKCKDSCDNHKIDYKMFNNSQEINNHFYYFDFPSSKEENYQALYEIQAGYLKSEDSVRVILNLARNNRANIVFGTKINDIEYKRELDCYELKRDLINNNLEEENNNNGEVYYAKKIVLSCGGWLNNLLTKNFKFKLPLTVDLNHVYYFKILTYLNDRNSNGKKNDEYKSLRENDSYEKLKNTPIFIIENDKEDEFYGFPDIKNGNYYKYSTYHQKIVHEDIKDIIREPNKSFFNKIKGYCKKFIKNFTEENVELIKEINCIYTSTPDMDYIIDFLPNTNQKIIICSACSGHGFKFGPVVGEIIKKLFNEECEPIKQFKIERFGNCYL